MNTISVPFLPTGLWLLATAGCIIVMLIIFAMYWAHRRRFQAVLGDSRDTATLAARKEQLQADVLELRNWITGQKDEMARLQAERDEQERLRGELTRLQHECATVEQRNIELRKEAGEFEAQRHTLAQTIERLGKESDTLGQRIAELEQKRNEMGSVETQLEEVRRAFDEAKKEISVVQKDREDLARQISEKRLELDTLRREYEGLDRNRQTSEQDAANAKVEAEKCRREAEEAERLLHLALQQLQTKKGELLLAEDKFDGLGRRTKTIEKEIIGEEQSLKVLRSEIAAGKISLAEIGANVQHFTNQAREAEAKHLEKAALLTKAENRLEEINRREKRLGNEVAVLELEKARLRKEIAGQPGDGGKADNSTYADLIQSPPPCLDRKLLPKKEFPYSDEERALAEVRSRLADAGYHFHERVVKAFHTALKCHDINPLTVLAGVSGTGKTLLPVEYAKLMGMHSLIIAVQPRWDSPQDMFGFYNYLEKRYKATDLARALIRMDPFNTIEGLDANQKCADRMFLVLLDEMNLARTEYYFSEFLSKLELRRLAGAAQTETERQHAAILLDTGPGRQPISFWVGRNVLFTGTMNEDESTQTLSDKVLDRANVLRFGRPAKKSTEGQGKENVELTPLGYLTAKQWEKWCRPVQTADWMGKAQEWIDSLNDALTKIGRPFGHRVRKSILTYVANYPGVNGDSFKIAFADQIEQKILPKLRGFDTTEGINNAAFDDIGKIVESTGDTTLLGAFKSAQENNAAGMFLWQGVTRQDDQA